jgi:hypothetical protein
MATRTAPNTILRDARKSALLRMTAAITSRAFKMTAVNGIYGGQIYPIPAGDLKQPTDSGITCLGSHSTTLGK